MAQVLHKRATTTHAIRAKLLRSKESVATLGKCYNINPKIVRRWRAHYSVEDAPMCPSHPRSISMTLPQVAVAVVHVATPGRLPACLAWRRCRLDFLKPTSLLPAVMILVVYPYLISLFALKPL